MPESGYGKIPPPAPAIKPSLTCDECRWWVRKPGEDCFVVDGKEYKRPYTKGECRRHPPSVLDDVMLRSVFPETKEDCFCSEFQYD